MFYTPFLRVKRINSSGEYIDASDVIAYCLVVIVMWWWKQQNCDEGGMVVKTIELWRKRKNKIVVEDVVHQYIILQVEYFLYPFCLIDHNCCRKAKMYVNQGLLTFTS